MFAAEWIKTCKLTDPALNECFRKSAEETQHKLKDGLPSLGVLPIDPLEIEKISLPSTGGAVSLNQVYKNVKLYGISDAKYLDVRLVSSKLKLGCTATEK